MENMRYSRRETVRLFEAGGCGRFDWQRFRVRAGKRLGLSLVHAQTAYGEVLERTLSPGDRWLDIGCGKRLMPTWAYDAGLQQDLLDRAGFVAGIDLADGIRQNRQLTNRLYAVAGRLPFPDGSFDLATANMVFEHLDDPSETLREIRRVLRPGGRLVFHTPNLRYYLVFLAGLIPDAVKRPVVAFLEHREDEDIFRTLYRINTRQAIQTAARRAGFEVDSVRLTAPFGSFESLGPIAIAELLVLKLHTLKPFRGCGETFIVTLRRRATRGFEQ